MLTFETLSSNESILKECNYTFHIDATGESVKKIDAAPKTVLIYKTVLHLKEKRKILTISDAILSRHTSSNIESFVIAFRSFCRDRNLKWPMAKRFGCYVFGTPFQEFIIIKLQLII